jgi:cytochrome c oxidase cbb3-type subunit 1
MISIGSLYHMIPRLIGREEMYSVRLIFTHFWLATIGTVIYIVAMWVSGIAQGLMWRAFNADGTLTYSFVESVEFSHLPYVARFIGGAIYLLGMFIMLFNVVMTLRQGKTVEPLPEQPVAQTA